MTSPRRRRLAWIPPALAIAIVATRLIAYPQDDVAVLVFNAAFVVYAAVGGLIVERQPRNAVGWLFCAIGLMFASGELYSDYQAHAAAPAGQTAFALVTSATASTGALIVALALMLFPTGRFGSPRWRRIAIALLVANAAWSIVLALEPGPLSADPDIVNPLGVDGAAGLLHTLADIGGLVLAATLIAPIVSVVARFRAARGIERQQLKWLAFAGAMSAVLLALVFGLGAVLDFDEGLGRVVAGTVLGVVVASPPVAAAIAILRYRLYDVDVVINRTLVYGALTATLAAAYLGSVLLVGLALGRSGLAVAVSTLAVAALFRPARARIQAAVDQRFYRRRYDAAHALAGFGARLRDEVELDVLSHELRGVVDECLQPAHVSLWLRAPRS